MLTPSEARQIAGRAGRFGIKESGEAGALTREDLKGLQYLLSIEPPQLEFARISPEIADISNMTGPLSQRLDFWEKHKAIPQDLKDVILPSDMTPQKTLAGFLKDEEVKRLGLETVFTLIKAPASRDTIGYWWACVKSVIDNRPFPLPLNLAQDSKGPREKEDTLLGSETIVEQCDIYLWLSNRQEVRRYGIEKEKVLNYKWSLIEKIDQTLTAKNDLRARCRKCGNTLPVIHSYSVCEECFRRGQRRYFARPKRRFS
jgi:ATP-dependent RNA helicase SUPV3L1/SUV3